MNKLIEINVYIKLQEGKKMECKSEAWSFLKSISNKLN